MQIDIPEDRQSQAALALRHAANEFHGAIAREPDAAEAAAWRASAAWFDAKAAELLAASTWLVRFK